MKFSKFAELVSRISVSPLIQLRDPEVTTFIYSPGSIGATPSVEVESIQAGFDLDAGQVLIYPAQPLTTLTPEQVADIKTSVRKGQSWHAFEAYKKHKTEVEGLKAQRDQLLAALEKYEQAFEEMFAQCCSNPVYDARGKPVQGLSTLSEAHFIAGKAITNIKGGAA
ncbi:BAR domain-containing protein [Klebsiella pneumoniae]|uniref:hypothetical protein n=1 Tax=Klebsiella pneumoniae TaxID=573 RepID=UPI000E2D21B7|nr:hypothetical protein [Klebsiella pneumoniae]SXZ03432.1 Uncharacterised protein [Klebsiella pneumoniae]